MLTAQSGFSTGHLKGRVLLLVLIARGSDKHFFRGPFFSILMPCSIAVYKKDNGKTYIGTMNAGLMGRLFGTRVAEIMGNVAKDQAVMLSFDPTKPAPPLIKTAPGAGAQGGEDTGGC